MSPTRRASSRSWRASSPSQKSPATIADGLLLVDKPAGVSSHDVVSAARRATGEQRIGHAGTLDPFATGLLVVLVGRATRLVQHVHDEPKEYEATVRFGTETDTEDLLGRIVTEAPLPSRETLDARLPRLLGSIEQVPPAFSAKHVAGKRAYVLARAGETVDLAPVRVTVHAITLDGFTGTEEAVESCRMRVSCGGGTYVRSLARDFARASGSAAHLTALRRLKAGVFSVDAAIALEKLQSGAFVLLPALEALAGYPRQELTPTELQQVSRGIDVEARIAGDRAALVTPGDSGGAPVLVAFAERRSAEKADRWQPRVVMREPESQTQFTQQSSAEIRP
ncbi:MAG: tRNA pseudouridine(55) synthase TruB [Gemmatimonadales bacterium]